jgi:hypothetical protein
LIEQASLDFADPDPDSDLAVIDRENPTIPLAVPEPAALSPLAAALAGLAATGWRSGLVTSGRQRRGA